MIYCPCCKLDFEAEPWEGGNCPVCGNEFWWDECCTEDYSDCWPIVEWEKWSPDVGEKT